MLDNKLVLRLLNYRSKRLLNVLLYTDLRASVPQKSPLTWSSEKHLVRTTEFPKLTRISILGLIITWSVFIPTLNMCKTEGVVRLCVSINSKIRGHYFIWQLLLQLRSELLTFIGPCIANVFAEYNQQDATFLNLFIYGRRRYMFQTVFPSIIRSSKLHIQRQVFVRPVLLPDAQCAVLSSWWWTEKSSETCSASYRNKEIEKVASFLVVLCEYPLRTFRVTACRTALAAIPVCGESGSTHFS